MAKGEIFKTLPTWSKGVISVAAVAAVGIISYLIYKKVKEQNALKSTKDELNSVDSEIKTLQKNVRPTLNSAQLSNTVNGIKNAF